MSERATTIDRPPDELLVEAVGAVLFASDEPVLATDLAETFGGLELGRIEEIIEALEQRHRREGTGLCIERVAGGVRLATRPDVGAWVRQFFRQRNRTRLSPAALETLAIVAYRQPVTSPEIQAIRGKDPSAALRGLLDKKLIRILGRKKVVGNPLLYGTTQQFLMHFGLDGLGDLPSIEEFDQFIEAFEQEGSQPGVAGALQAEPGPNEATPNGDDAEDTLAALDLEDRG